jgi:hypothetical protein
MPSARPFLNSGEHVLYSITKSPIARPAEELIATDSRIIHVRGKTYFDISYNFLSSVEKGRRIEWKWAKRAAYALLVSLICISLSLLLPVVIAQSIQDISGEVNALTQQMLSTAIPQGNMDQYNDTLGLPSLNFTSLYSGVDDGAVVSGYSAQADSWSLETAGILSMVGAIAFFISLVLTLVFILGIKRCIILRAEGHSHIFTLGRGQERESMEFIRVARAVSIRGPKKETGL